MKNNLHPTIETTLKNLFGAELLTTKKLEPCPVCHIQIQEYDETTTDELGNEIHKNCKHLK